MGFGVVLDFQVHHFLDEFNQRFGMHIRSDPDKHPLRRRVRPAVNWLAHAKPFGIVAPVRFLGKI